MLRILYFVQLPPPVHGVSTINKYIVNSKIINEGIETKILEIKFSEKISELKRITLNKCLKALILLFKLISTIRKFKPDYVYFSIMPVGKGFIRDVVFVMVIRFFNVTPVYHLHNKGIRKAEGNFILKSIYRLVFKDSIIIHLSESLMESEFNFLKLKNVKKFIVNNGVEEIQFDKIYKKNENINLLYLSNLFPEKGLDTLMKSVLALRKEGRNISLNVIGSPRGRYLNKQKHFLHDEKLTWFRGEQFSDEKNKYLLEADIFILPTINDSFPLVILEAMQFGLPVISTYEGAIPEIVENGVTGILIEKGNIQQLTDSTRLLIDNYETRIMMGMNGRKKYLEKYTKTKFENNIREIIEGLDALHN